MKYRFRVSVTWSIDSKDPDTARSIAEGQIKCLGMDPEVDFLGTASIQSLHVDSVGQISSSKMR